jgi:hypothetical protein
MCLKSSTEVHFCSPFGVCRRELTEIGKPKPSSFATAPAIFVAVKIANIAEISGRALCRERQVNSLRLRQSISCGAGNVAGELYIVRALHCQDQPLAVVRATPPAADHSSADGLWSRKPRRAVGQAQPPDPSTLPNVRIPCAQSHEGKNACILLFFRPNRKFFQRPRVRIRLLVFLATGPHRSNRVSPFRQNQQQSRHCQNRCREKP